MPTTQRFGVSGKVPRWEQPGAARSAPRTGGLVRPEAWDSGQGDAQGPRSRRWEALARACAPNHHPKLLMAFDENFSKYGV